MKTREEDFVSQLIVDSTHAYLLCFTNTGRVYWLKVYEVPDVGAAGKGKSMASLLNLQPGENVRTILPVRNLEEEGKFIFFATRKGTVKKTPLKDFCNVMARGIIAIGIDDDDELIGACSTDGNQIIFLATHAGMAIRFGENDVRSMGRPAYGVRGIDLMKSDYLVGLAATPLERKKNGTGGQIPFAHSFHYRAGLWQTHRCGRVPAADPRRTRRHQRQDHDAQRQGERHPVGR